MAIFAFNSSMPYAFTLLSDNIKERLANNRSNGNAGRITFLLALAGVLVARSLVIFATIAIVVFTFITLLMMSCKHAPEKMRVILTELVNPREILMCLGPVTYLPHAAILGTMLLVNIVVPIMFFINSRDQRAT
eukprot:gene28551-31711_t